MTGLFERTAARLAEYENDPRRAWRQTARPDQLLPRGEWRTVYYQGGRGSGKTRSCAQGLADMILSDPDPGEWAIVAPTYRDAWTTCVEGESGFLPALGTTTAEVKEGRSKYVKAAWRSYGEIHLRNGHVVRADSANDGALRVQGKNLKGAWCDEIGLWQNWEVAWDESIAYAVRRGDSRIIASGTPKASRPAAKLIRRLIAEDSTIVRRLRTVDNLGNLSKAFYDAIVARASGTRLERQELEGELLDDVENALWTRLLLDEQRRDELPYPGTLINAVVGVDPSDGTGVSDEQAFTVAGKAGDHQLYVVESFGARVGPTEFLRRVVEAALRWNAQIVVEKNHGGAYLLQTLEQVIKDMQASVGYRAVNASQSKRTRAEPVAALYERRNVHHVGDPFVELEDQMVTYTGAVNERSPDRLDSLVWALTPFLGDTFSESEATAMEPIPYNNLPEVAGNGPTYYDSLSELDEMVNAWP